MARSRIEWLNMLPGYIGQSWNPVDGCTPVSEGCAHCWAKTYAKRFWGRRDFSEVRLHPERLTEPLHWRKPRLVFVCPLGDLFHPDVPDEYIDKVIAVIQKRYYKDKFIILTKRAERMEKYFNDRLEKWRRTLLTQAYQEMNIQSPSVLVWPIPNLWLMVTVENQARASERIPHLLATAAVVRGVSAEPLLGDIEFCWPRELDWVIVGGESGPSARPMHPDWVRSIRDQCQAADTAFFFKQWGAWAPCRRMHNRTWCWEDGTLSRRIGKHKAGRLLDGRTWDQYPI